MRRTLTTAPAPTVNRLLDSIDGISSAHMELTSRAIVLERLFELLSNAHNEGGATTTVDFCEEHEEAFWYGLQLMVRQMRETGDVLKAGATSLYQRAKDGAR